MMEDKDFCTCFTFSGRSLPLQLALAAGPVVFASSLWPLHTRNRGLFVSLSGFASLCGHQREQGSRNDRMSAHPSPNTHTRVPSIANAFPDERPA